MKVQLAENIGSQKTPTIAIISQNYWRYEGRKKGEKRNAKKIEKGEELLSDFFFYFLSAKTSIIIPHVIFQEFPKANIVITHRHPDKVLPSWAKLNAIIHFPAMHNDTLCEEVEF